MRRNPARLVRVIEDRLDGVDEELRDVLRGRLALADEFRVISASAWKLAPSP